MSRLGFKYDQVVGFCAGNNLYAFWENTSHSTESPQECITRSFSHCNQAMMLLCDCEDGVADKLLFSKLKSNEGSFPYEGGFLHYHLSNWYYNKNSGNMCRHLSVWHEMTEDQIEEHRADARL